jgi:hypothetical protein
MIMSSLRIRAVALGLAALIGGAVAAPAVAATNVVIEVQIQARIFRKDPDTKGLNHVHPRTRRQVKALIPRYRRLEKRFRTAATAVSRARATTSSQRLGRRQWVRGARTFANGLHELDAGLMHILHHKPSQANRTISAADRRLQNGDKLIAAGNHTLGLR